MYTQLQCFKNWIFTEIFFVAVQKWDVNLQCWNGYISQTVHCPKIPLQNEGLKSKCDRMNEQNWPAMNRKTQGPSMVGSFLFATSRPASVKRPSSPSTAEAWNACYVGLTLRLNLCAFWLLTADHLLLNQANHWALAVVKELGNDLILFHGMALDTKM
jgi:hypothetical protein